MTPTPSMSARAIAAGTSHAPPVGEQKGPHLDGEVFSYAVAAAAGRVNVTALWARTFANVHRRAKGCLETPQLLTPTLLHMIPSPSMTTRKVAAGT